MEILVIIIFGILLIVGTVGWRFYTLAKTQPGQNVGNQPQVQPVQTQQTGDKWLPIKVGGGILSAFLIIGLLSWVLNGETNYKLKEGKVYSQKISFGDKFNFSGNGKKFYASTDGVNWVLVGAGEPRHEFGRRVNVFYMKYYEPKTVVTVKVD